MENIYLLIAGGLGALAKDLVKDNCIVLPSFQNGKYNLGFIGVMIIGSFIGFMVDHNPLTACLSGYVGISVLNDILPITRQRKEINPE
jgi:hypothetical protein